MLVVPLFIFGLVRVGISVAAPSLPPVVRAVVFSASAAAPYIPTAPKQKTKKIEKAVSATTFAARQISTLPAPVPAPVESEWDGKCPVCGQGESAYEGMVACDSCNDWFHFVCVGYKEKPPEMERTPVVSVVQQHRNKKSKKRQQVELPVEEDGKGDNWYCRRCISGGRVPN